MLSSALGETKRIDVKFLDIEGFIGRHAGTYDMHVQAALRVFTGVRFSGCFYLHEFVMEMDGACGTGFYLRAAETGKSKVYKNGRYEGLVSDDALSIAANLFVLRWLATLSKDNEDINPCLRRLTRFAKGHSEYKLIFRLVD